MAFTQQANVYRVTSDEDFSQIKNIHSIKYISSAAGTAIIKDKNSSGDQLWEASGADEVYEHLHIKGASKGISVILTGTALIYIYT